MQRSEIKYGSDPSVSGVGRLFDSWRHLIESRTARLFTVKLSKPVLETEVRHLVS